jgi:hypothetical protein
MTIKSYVTVEITKGDNQYTFVMPVGSPYGEAYDAAFEVLKTVADLATKAADQTERKDAKNSEQAAAVEPEIVS